MIFDDTEDVMRTFDFALPSGGESGVLEADSDEKVNRVAVRLWGFEKPGGDIVWRGSRILCAELLRINRSLRGASVLELGASSGLPAALCAALGAHAVATDGLDHVIFGQVPLLAKNVELFSDELSLGGSFAASALDWGFNGASEAVKPNSGGEQPLLSKGAFDYVIGAEIVYMPAHIPELAESIAFFLSDNGQAIIANTAVATNTSQREARDTFVTKLEELGLCVALEQAPDGPVFKSLHAVDLALHDSWSESAYVMRICRRQ